MWDMGRETTGRRVHRGSTYYGVLAIFPAIIDAKVKD